MVVVTEEEFSKRKKVGMKMDDLDKSVHITPTDLTMNDGKKRGHIFELTPRALGGMAKKSPRHESVYGALSNGWP